MMKSKNNFWLTLPKPIICLAPMEEVTDTVFRETILSSAVPGNLHVLFTEFTSVDGLLHPAGNEIVTRRLWVNKSEREILKTKNIRLVAQIWGKEPKQFFEATKRITAEYDFDGIDINMGCPVRKVVKNGCCSALIDQPEKTKEIIHATKMATHLPVSVKTRIGYKNVATERWIRNLADTNPAAIILHGRTQKMMSEGQADWNEIQKAAHILQTINPEIPLIGNGDILSLEQARGYAAKYNTSGIMIGRGVFQNPLIFSETFDNTPFRSIELLQKHLQLFQKTWKNKKSYLPLKRFYKIYLNRFPGAAAWRARFMQSQSIDEAMELTNALLKIMQASSGMEHKKTRCNFATG